MVPRIFASSLTLLLLPALSAGLLTPKLPGSKNALLRPRRSAHEYLAAADTIDDRLGTVLQQIKRSIGPATLSVEDDIAIANRDRSILGLANFLGMLFGIASGASGNPALGQLSTGDQVQVAAQFLYGYGYWGPFLLDFEEARLDCNEYDLQAVLDEYAFLTDMGHNYGYLDGYHGSSPRDHLTDVSDPIVLQYYAVEFNHAIKRSLYCIVSRKGSNSDALELSVLIDLYTQLLTERLAMTDEAISTYNANRI